MEIGQRFATFCLTIENIAKNVQRYKTLRMMEFRLRSTHVMCLYQLRQAPEGLTASELADVCHVDKGFVSRVTRELAEKNYLTYQTRESGGRYRRRLALSESGREMTDRLLEMVDQAVVEADGETTPEELAVFYRVLQTIDRNLDHLIEKTEEEIIL